jgi:hypothetical protein
MLMPGIERRTNRGRPDSARRQTTAPTMAPKTGPPPQTTNTASAEKAARIAMTLIALGRVERTDVMLTPRRASGNDRADGTTGASDRLMHATGPLGLTRRVIFSHNREKPS